MLTTATQRTSDLDSAPGSDNAQVPAVSVAGLRRSYGDFEAVRGIDLEIARGEIVATGTPDSLGERRQLAAEISFSIPRGVELRELPVGIGAPGTDGAGKVRVQTDDPVSTLFSLTRWALEHDHELPDLELRRPTLEDVYLHLTATAD